MSDLDREYSLLRSVLTYPHLGTLVQEVIRAPEAFERWEVRALWQGAVEVLRDGRSKLDAYVVSLAVERLGLLRQFQGQRDEVVRIYHEALSWEPWVEPDNAVELAKSIWGEYRGREAERKALEFAQKVRRAGPASEREIAQFAAEIQNWMTETDSTRDRGIGLGDAMAIRVDRWDEIQRGETQLLGLPTGFPKLDRAVGGLQEHHLILLGAWWKGGKSSTGLGMSLQVGLKHDEGVFYAILEMDAMQMADRVFSIWLGIDPNELRWGTVNKAEWERTVRRVKNHADIPEQYLNRLNNVHVFDAAGMSVQEIEGAYRAWNYRRVQAGLKPGRMVVVDYLQLVQPPLGIGAGQRQVEVDRIGKELIEFKKRHPITLLAMTQLSAEEDGDTRESKALQGHCDSFWRIRREKDPKTKELTNFANLELVYNRHAAGGGVKIPLIWSEARLSYREADSKHPEENEQKRKRTEPLDPEFDGSVSDSSPEFSQMSLYEPMMGGSNQIDDLDDPSN